MNDKPPEALIAALDKQIEEAHQVLADTFALLHTLHHKRGELFYLKSPKEAR